MIRIVILSLLIILSVPTNIKADVSKLLFSRLTAEDGLCDNQVMHVMQLPDERMLFTTLGNINIYDGVNFSHIHHADIEPFHLKDYHGFYHVYVDKRQMVWIKNTQSLMCFDLQQNRYITDIPEFIKEIWPEKNTITDVFVDTDYHLWLLSGRALWNDYSCKSVNLSPAWGEVQDVDVYGQY